MKIYSHKGIHREGVRAVEIDVHLTRDEIAIMRHDEMVGEVSISTLDYNQVSDQKKLYDILKMLHNLKYEDVIIELKPVIGRECLIAEIVNSIVIHNEHLFKSVILSSFSMEIIKHLLDIRRSAYGVAYNCFTAPVIFQENNGVSALVIEKKAVTKELINEVHSAGSSIGVFVVNGRMEAEMLKAMEVDFIVSDTPEDLTYLENQ